MYSLRHDVIQKDINSDDNYQKTSIGIEKFLLLKQMNFDKQDFEKFAHFLKSHPLKVKRTVHPSD